MLRTRIPLLALLALLGLFHQVPAQAWPPAGADLGRPIALMKAAEVPPMLAAIAARPDLDKVFWRGGNLAFGAIPPGNTTLTERQVRGYIAKEAAFHLFIGHRWQSTGPAPLSPVEADTLRIRCLSLLNEANTAVDDLTNYENWIWRSRDLMNFLHAYDLLMAAGVDSLALRPAYFRLKRMAGDLHYQATRNIFGFSFYNFANNNHGLCTSAALAFAACVLHDADSTDANYRAASWASTGIWNLDNILWRSSSRQCEPGQNAGYGEGPHYFKVAFQNLIPAFKALHHLLPDGQYPFTFSGTTRSIRHPWHDPEYRQLYAWATAIRLPDGRIPAIDDSYNNDYLHELAYLGDTAYVLPDHFDRLEGVQGQSIDGYTAQINDMRPDFLAAHTPVLPLGLPTYQSWPEAGSLVMRSGWDTTATYFHLLAEHGRARTAGGGHNQADVTSFILHAHGQLLAMDPGYISYSDRLLVAGPSSHNMILVDGAGPPAGTTGSPGDVDGFIEQGFDTPLLDYGEARATYLGAAIQRRALFVRGAYVILGDRVTRSTPASFQWQLHGYGRAGGAADEGHFAQDTSARQAIWGRNEVHLLATVTASQSQARHDTTTDRHDLANGHVRYHNTLRLTTDTLAGCDFLAFLTPFVGDTPAVAVRREDAIIATTHIGGGFHDLAFSHHDTLPAQLPAGDAGLPFDLVSDARLCFLSHDSAGRFSQLFLESGTSLWRDTFLFASAQPRMDLAWQVLGPDHAMGYAGAAGTVQVPWDTVPVSVWGQYVTGWSYSAASGLITVQTSAPTYIHAFPSFVAGARPGVEGEGSALLELWPVPARGDVRALVRLSTGGHLRMRVLDLRGREVAALDCGHQEAGVGEVGLRLPDLSAGMYLLAPTLDGVPFPARRVLVR